MPLKRITVFCLAISLLILALPAGAQDSPDTTRDSWSLARRLLGFEADYAIPTPTPLYKVGDTADFWVPKPGSDTPTRITARLAASTADMYLWVEDDLPFQADAMTPVITQLDQILGTLRLRAVYGEPTIIPDVGEVTDPTSLLQMPDVDNDPHLFIVYVSDLGSPAYIISSNDGLPAEIAPGGYSNQHELIAINTAILPDAPLDNGAYTTIVVEAIYEFLAQAHMIDQDPWLREALGELVGRLLELPDIRPDAPAAFLDNPNISLIRPASSTSGLAARGGQQVFMDYVSQRFGFAYIQHLFQQPGLGLAPFDAAFEETGTADSVSGRIITGDQFFADFAAANAASYVANHVFGDGRYIHQMADLPADRPPAGYVVRDNFDTELADAPVAQYGTEYVYIGSNKAASFTLSFDGQPTTPLLPLPEDADPDNHFYWSGRGSNQDTTLTQSFNLAGLDQATLTFDLWHDMPDALNYAYVEVSTDGGDTWDLLAGDLHSTNNRYGLAYGPGYSGISSREAPTPFPILGVLLGADGVTVQEVSPGGPASSTDLKAGDVIIGYDEQPWPGPADVIALLGNYDAGDTLDLYVQRGQDLLSISIVLGAHPTRVKQPDPVWVSQEIDLSPYAGQEIMLRFEYISQPQASGNGVAVDNIAIPELDYVDDAEGTRVWTLNGWQQVKNEVAQRFLVQYISSGTQDEPPRVRQLISPEDDATSGQWHFHIDPQEVLAFAISGLNDDTLIPAYFSIKLSTANL